jgi:L-lactate dehydrogenase complex protein LldE
MTESRKQVSLFIPCLVDQIYPEMGLAMVDVLEHLGYECLYDSHQVCCGQPAYNAGQLDEARKVAKGFVNCFSGTEIPIVCPSGSCTAMVRNHYGRLFDDDESVKEIAGRTFEFSEFLHKQQVIDTFEGRFPAKAVFHCSCHALRDLGMDREVPRALLERITGLELMDAEGPHQCCGFGGLFYVKFPAISDAMTEKRLQQLLDSGADLIVSNDPGCIMVLRRMLKKQGKQAQAMHLTELMAKAVTNS